MMKRSNRSLLAAPILLALTMGMAAAEPAPPEPAGGAQGMSRLLPDFSTPPRSYSPVPIWWWSGERLEMRRLEWQMDRMLEGHVYNTVVLNLAPSGPLYGSQPDAPAFFSPGWWNILRGVLDRAKARGMHVWLYDQLGFSTARIQERLMERQPAWRAPELRVIERDITGPSTVRIASPGRAVAACALALDDDGRLTGRIENVTGSLAEGYLTKRMPAGRWRMMLFHEAPGGFDYMSPTAAGKLLNFVHGEFERKLKAHLGKTIPGTFQDELPPMNRWTRNFLDEFRRRKGYDLRAWLPMLWYELGQRTPRVRCDVADVQAALLEEAFFRPLYAWHERHGMICSYDQMTRDADPIEANRYYVDYMRTMRWFQAPGADQTGLARPHSSLAHLYRRPRVWLEGFYNSGWGQTLEEVAGRIHEFYAQGANLYNPHAWYYSTLGGWWEWAPPCTSFRQPYWKHYPLFSDYVSRLSYALSQGSHVTDIAVLYPSSTIHAGGAHTGTYNDEAKRSRDAYRSVCSRLEDLGVDYDVLDEASLLRSRVDGGLVRVADERYRCVIMPSVTTLPRSAVQKLAELGRSGGIVAAAGTLPTASPDYGADDPTVRTAMQALFGPAQDATELVVRRGAIHAPAETERLIDAVVERLPRHAIGAVRYIHRRVGARDVYFLVGQSGRKADVTLRGGGSATLLLPWTGRRLPLAVRSAGAGKVTVTVDFSESRAVFVALSGAAGIQTASASRPASPETRPTVFAATSIAPAPRLPRTHAPPQPITLASEWESALTPTLDNRWGDFSRPASDGSPPVECRQFAYREEASGEDGLAEGWHSIECADADWQRVTATFGTHWWITRPGVGDRSLKLPGPEDADWRPDRAVWQRAVFSLKSGIEKDPIYSQWLGPKGRVPDEYLDFGVAPAGEVRFAVTFVHVDEPCDVLIQCGAGDARIAVNGRWLPADQPLVAHLLAGYNAVTGQFRHTSGGRLRTYVHIGPATQEENGPAWIWTDKTGAMSDCFARRTFTLDAVPQRAVLAITADNGYEVYVNGERVGRDVGAGSDRWATAERYSVARLLRRGQNAIAVHGVNLGGPAGLAAVLSWPAPSPQQGRRSIITDGSWKVRASRPAQNKHPWTAPGYDDSTWAPATIVGRYPCEPWGVITGLRRAEPSILPESAWLNGEVLPWTPGLIMDPKPGIAKPVGWYRFRTPPGASSMRLPMVGRSTVYVEGRECEIGEGGLVEVPLDLQGPSLQVAVRIEQAAGRYEGAAFAAPVSFSVERGLIRPGNWAVQGLPHYSGGLTYRQSVVLPAVYADGPMMLDLGRVRGTAQVTVNGKSAGVRIWRPYRFDVTGLLRAGGNRIEVTVLNTLGPFFGAGYPTPYVLNGQQTSGMFGPVRLLADGPPERPRADLTGLTNVALTALGATASASSEHASGLYLADSVVAGHTSGDRWARGGGWNDGTEGEFPDWIEVALPEPVVVRAVRVITLEPAARFGIRDFDVLYRRGSEWVRLAEIRDNEDAVVAVAAPSVRTSRVRIVVNGANDEAYSRIIAVQVFAPGTEVDAPK